jgi:glutaredoxin-related protein
VHFWAGWCEPCKLLDTVLKQLGDDAPSVTCVRVEAEEASDVSEHCGVAVVPLFAFYSGGKEVDRLEGAEPATLTQKFLALANGPTSEAAPASNAAAPPAVANGTMPVQERLKALVKQAPIMLFMKGNPDAPRCGFSGRVVEALRAAGADNFGHFDILTDEAVRQGLKEYSNWPTYPQL